MRGLLGIALIPLVIAGCTSSEPPYGGTPRENQQPKIVSLSPSTTELAFGINRQQVLHGRTASANYPNAVQSIPVISEGPQPNYERIAATGPDGILLDGDLYSAAELEKLKEITPNIFIIDSNTIEDFTKEVLRLSVMIGGETNASKYVDKILREKEIAEGIPEDKRPTAIAVMGEQGEYRAAGSDSFVYDLLQSSGLSARGPEGKMWETVSAEKIITWDPEIVIASGDAAAARFQDDPRFAGLKAVKNGRVFGSDPDILLRRGSRVDKLMAQLRRVATIAAGLEADGEAS